MGQIKSSSNEGPKHHQQYSRPSWPPPYAELWWHGVRDWFTKISRPGSSLGMVIEAVLPFMRRLLHARFNLVTMKAFMDLADPNGRKDPPLVPAPTSCVLF